MDLGQGNELCNIGGNPLVFEEIIIKRTDSAQLSFYRQFMIDIFFVRYRINTCIFQIIGQVFGVGGNIIPGQFFQIGVIIKDDVLI